MLPQWTLCMRPSRSLRLTAIRTSIAIALDANEVVADQLASPHVAGPDHRAAIGATCRRRSESVTRALPYLYLALAIGFEVVGTSALKASETFTRLVPALVTLIAYTASFALLAP